MTGAERETWDTAFVAVSVVAGEPVELAVRALGERPSPSARALLRKLGAGSREARARALARVVSEVALAIDALRLT